MTVSGFEPATSMLVAQFLNQLQHCNSYPEIYVSYLSKTKPGLVVRLQVLASITGAFFN
jgi:hypothetical protein